MLIQKVVRSDSNIARWRFFAEFCNTIGTEAKCRHVSYDVRYWDVSGPDADMVEPALLTLSGHSRDLLGCCPTARSAWIATGSEHSKRADRCKDFKIPWGIPRAGSIPPVRTTPFATTASGSASVTFSDRS